MASKLDFVSVLIAPLAKEEDFSISSSELSDSVDSLGSDPISQHDDVHGPGGQITHSSAENEQSGLMSRLGWSDNFANKFLDERISDKSSHWLYVFFLSLICFDSLKQKLNHAIFERIFLNAFLPILAFLIDIIFDIKLLWAYWSEKSMWYFTMTLIFIVVPTLLQLVMCISLEFKSNWKWKKFFAIFLHSRTAR